MTMTRELGPRRLTDPAWRAAEELLWQNVLESHTGDGYRLALDAYIAHHHRDDVPVFVEARGAVTV